MFDFNREIKVFYNMFYLGRFWKLGLKSWTWFKNVITFLTIYLDCNMSFDRLSKLRLSKHIFVDLFEKRLKIWVWKGRNGKQTHYLMLENIHATFPGFVILFHLLFVLFFSLLTLGLLVKTSVKFCFLFNFASHPYCVFSLSLTWRSLCFLVYFIF